MVSMGLLWLIVTTHSTTTPETANAALSTVDTLPQITINDSPHCDCTGDWHCKPHNMCFIHKLCLCPSSGAFPPARPPQHKVKLLIGHIGHKPLRHATCKVSHVKACVTSQASGSGSTD